MVASVKRIRLCVQLELGLKRAAEVATIIAAQQFPISTRSRRSDPIFFSGYGREIKHHYEMLVFIPAKIGKYRRIVVCMVYPFVSCWFVVSSPQTGIVSIDSTQVLQESSETPM